jgi:hypothetical protein
VRREFGRGGVIAVNAGEEHRRTSVAQGRRKGETGEGGGVRVDFIGQARLS